jgi:hypothetical protein
MSDLDPASVPNDLSCKPHREGSDNGYLGWQTDYFSEVCRVLSCIAFPVATLLATNAQVERPVSQALPFAWPPSRYPDRLLAALVAPRIESCI